MNVKILVDVDVLEALLDGFGDDCPYDDQIVSAAEPNLRAEIKRARSAK